MSELNSRYSLVDLPLWSRKVDKENDLIVMTTHGRGPLSRFWLGSVADELVRRATVPLLLIRPQGGTSRTSLPNRRCDEFRSLSMDQRSPSKCWNQP